MVKRAYIDGHTELALHTNIRFRRHTAHVQRISKTSSTAKRTLLRVMRGVTLPFSLTHQIIISELRFCKVATITLFPVHLLQRKLKCSANKNKNACLLRKKLQNKYHCTLVVILLRVGHVTIFVQSVYYRRCSMCFCDSNLIHTFDRSHAYSGSRIQTI